MCITVDGKKTLNMSSLNVSLNFRFSQDGNDGNNGKYVCACVKQCCESKGTRKRYRETYWIDSELI